MMTRFEIALIKTVHHRHFGQTKGYWLRNGTITAAVPAPSIYCFGRAPVAGLGADPVKPPEMRERMDSILERSSEFEEVAGLFGLAGATDDSAVGIFSDVGGVLSIDDLRGGSPSGDPPGGGVVAPGVIDEGPGGVLSLGAGEASDGGLASLVPDCGGRPAAGGVSTLPRMIGRPSLPPPMTTIFALGDCASASVASMPRQRRYESEIC